MVTGVYDPETSGASLQCKQLIAGLQSAADFTVLTTSADRALPRRDVVDGTPVFRIYVDPAKPFTKLTATAAILRVFLSLAPRVDVLHIHGFSQKNILVSWLARLARIPIVMKLTSHGHDDAETMQRKGRASYRVYQSVDRAIAVSPALERAWQNAGLDANRVIHIPNAVDAQRFHPPADGERATLKRAYAWDANLPVVLFVGFFSHEKRPDLLYRAWATLWGRGVRSTLVIVGATRSAYYEVDAAMAEEMRADARRRGLQSHLVLVERAPDIENYYRAADIFALPTTREGLPNVLLEAMATGVAPVVSNLPGVTDWIVKDGISGRLVPPHDEAAFVEALRNLLENDALRESMGAAARRHVEEHFAPHITASRTLDVYRALVPRPRPS
jgi:glycosyltransferase involved in cell wall biosynthesis